MVDTQTREILTRNDSPTDVEAPAGFDWRAEWANVRAFQQAAEAVLGEPLEVDESIQDATHFAQLFILEDGARGPNGWAGIYKLDFRFSSFGRMATIWTNSPTGDLTRYPISQLIELLGKHGFVYIDPDLLAAPYDGKLALLDPDSTWWTRFFDYV